MSEEYPGLYSTMYINLSIDSHSSTDIDPSTDINSYSRIHSDLDNLTLSVDRLYKPKIGDTINLFNNTTLQNLGPC